MDLLMALIALVVVMVWCLTQGLSMIIALLVGLAAFLLVGKRRGSSVSALWHMAWTGAKDAVLIIKVLLVIGVMTAAWRVSGTIVVFVYYGMGLITPRLFLLIAFLLACILSYAIGTSFGVAGTVGVIFMALARSGGVDPVVTGGVILSGIYFGDRCSPVSSSANMVAGVTGTEIFSNVKQMMRTAALPFALTLLLYIPLSVMHPISHVDADMVQAMEADFNLSPWSFLPAVLMLVLPLLKVSVIPAMGVSIGLGILVACLVQGTPLPEVLKVCVLGYAAQKEGLGSLLNGGGLISMVEICVILLISCAYAGIFNETRMLDNLQELLQRACSRIGRFAVMVGMSIAGGVVFCNQTVTTLLCAELLRSTYGEDENARQEQAIDLENSSILISCMIPWSIGCSIPLAILNVSAAAVPYALFMYLVPICYLFTKKHWYPN